MSKKVVFVADFFVEQVLGGGELNNEELIIMLRDSGYEVEKTNSKDVTSKFLETNKESFFIISNFVFLEPNHRNWLTNNAQYVIYEHDHKYVKSRNPAFHKDFEVPSSLLLNFRFYREAQSVICQSQFHKSIVLKNIKTENVTSVDGNLWSEKSLELLEKLSLKNKKETHASVLDSPFASKNTPKTVSFCKHKGIEFELVKDNNYERFLEKLSNNKKFVFLPTTPETLSRIVCEARMMGMSVLTNELVGACQEPWFKLKGAGLIDVMRTKRKEIFDTIVSEIETPKQAKQNPKVSIVTTFHDGEEYLDGFLKNIVEQSRFKDCELVIVDAASSGNEKKLIEKYQKQNQNIVYIRLEEKLKPTPCINLAIQKSKGEYIHLSLIDDRKSPKAVELLIEGLEKNIDVGLVYGDVFVSTKPNETYKQNNKKVKSEHSSFEFSRENMIKCLPGPMPMWRYNLHEVLGFFDDLECNYADDWEMWLRMVQHGISFKKIKQPVGLYLTGGRSQIQDNLDQRKEEAKLFFKYANVFGYNYNKYYNYFNQFMR